MRWVKGVVAASLAAWLALAAPATARDLTDPELAALDETVESFETALERSDHLRMLETLPPRMLEALAAQVGATVPEMLAAVGEQLKTVADAARFEDVVFDAAQLGEAHDIGDGLVYGFLPLHFVMILPDGRFEVSSDVLALRDGDVWYLLRVENAAMASLLTGVYPGLRGVEFSSDRIRQLDD